MELCVVFFLITQHLDDRKQEGKTEISAPLEPGFPRRAREQGDRAL